MNRHEITLRGHAAEGKTRMAMIEGDDGRGRDPCGYVESLRKDHLPGPSDKIVKEEIRVLTPEPA